LNDSFEPLYVKEKQDVKEKQNHNVKMLLMELTFIIRFSALDFECCAEEFHKI